MHAAWGWHDPPSGGSRWTLMKEPACSDQTLTLLRICPGSGRPRSPDSPRIPTCLRELMASRPRSWGDPTPAVYHEELEFHKKQTPQWPLPLEEPGALSAE